MLKYISKTKATQHSYIRHKYRKHSGKGQTGIPHLDSRVKQRQSTIKHKSGGNKHLKKRVFTACLGHQTLPATAETEQWHTGALYLGLDGGICC